MARRGFFLSVDDVFSLWLVTRGDCGTSHQAEDSTVQPTARQLLAVPKVATKLLRYEADLLHDGRQEKAATKKQAICLEPQTYTHI